MTLGAIKDDLLDKSVTAVSYALDAIREDLHIYIFEYYGDYSQIRYRRTGKLGRTPYIPEPAHSTGSGASGKVGLNTGIGYSTGTPWTMEQVIDSAEAGLHGGYPYGGGVPFWSEAEFLMQSRVDEGCSAAGF